MEEYVRFFFAGEILKITFISILFVLKEAGQDIWEEVILF